MAILKGGARIIILYDPRCDEQRKQSGQLKLTK